MLEIKNVSKSFDGNRVLKEVSLTIEKGEVYGIIGTNGSGKSTLMNILNGNDAITKTGGYEGEIRIDGKEVKITSHKHSAACGIAMVHQELALFHGMSVTENIKINRENVKFKGLLLPELDYVDRKKNRQDAAAALEQIGSELSPDEKIDRLSLNQKHFVELARELDHRQIRLLILDEPTSSLNVTETDRLLQCIRSISAAGISVIFISHRLEEIMEICDTVSILRDGELIQTYGRDEFDIEAFASGMAGCEIVKACRRKEASERNVLFRYENINRTGENLDILEGEILGITGLAGQGQEQFLDGLFGLKAADYDAVYKGSSIRRGDPAALIRAGIYYLSEDRAGTSLFPDSPVWKNMMFGTELRHPEFLSWKQCPPLSFLNKREIKAYTEEMIEKLNIVCRGPSQKVRNLSGGNQQKVCVSRALTFRPELLFIGEPTRGIDIYSKELILEWLLKMNQDYKTTVVISSGELEELARICDRIAVVYQGRIFRIFTDNVSLEELSLALYGRSLYEA